LSKEQAKPEEAVAYLTKWFGNERASLAKKRVVMLKNKKQTAFDASR
jgi:hypothetical protein